MNRGDLISINGTLCATTDNALVTYVPFRNDYDIDSIGNQSASDFFANSSPCSITTERWKFNLLYDSDNYLVGCSKELVDSYSFPNVDTDLTVPGQDYRYCPISYNYTDSSNVVHSNSIYDGDPHDADTLEALYATRIPVVGSQFGLTTPWPGATADFWDVKLAGLSSASTVMTFTNVGIRPIVSPVFSYKCSYRVSTIDNESGNGYRAETHVYDISHVVWSPNLYCAIDGSRSATSDREAYSIVNSFSPTSHRAITRSTGGGSIRFTDDDKLLQYDVNTSSWVHRIAEHYPVLPLFEAGAFTFDHTTMVNGVPTTESVTKWCPAPTFRRDKSYDAYGYGYYYPNYTTFLVNGSFTFPTMNLARTRTYI